MTQVGSLLDLKYAERKPQHKNIETKKNIDVSKLKSYISNWNKANPTWIHASSKGELVIQPMSKTANANSYAKMLSYSISLIEILESKNDIRTTMIYRKTGCDLIIRIDPVRVFKASYNKNGKSIDNLYMMCLLDIIAEISNSSKVRLGGF